MYFAKDSKISLASLNLFVTKVSPSNAIIVSLPQSVNQGSPANTVFNPVLSLFTIKWSPALTKLFANSSFKLAFLTKLSALSLYSFTISNPLLSSNPSIVHLT